MVIIKAKMSSSSPNDDPASDTQHQQQQQMPDKGQHNTTATATTATPAAQQQKDPSNPTTTTNSTTTSTTTTPKKKKKSRKKDSVANSNSSSSKKKNKNSSFSIIKFKKLKKPHQEETASNSSTITASSSSSTNNNNNNKTSTDSSKNDSSTTTTSNSNTKTFKDAAAYVLRLPPQKPLTVKQIYHKITELDLYQTSGKTPWNSVAAQLYTDMKNKGELSRFLQPGPGLFTLRDLYIPGQTELMMAEEAAAKKNGSNSAGNGEAGGASSSGGASHSSANGTTTKHAEKRKDHDVFRFEHKPLLTPILFNVDVQSNTIPNRFMESKKASSGRVAATAKKRKRHVYETDSEDEEDVFISARDPEFHVGMGLFNNRVAADSKRRKPNWMEYLDHNVDSLQTNSKQQALLDTRRNHLTSMYQYYRNETLQLQSELQDLYDFFIHHRNQFYERVGDVKKGKESDVEEGGNGKHIHITAAESGDSAVPSTSQPAAATSTNAEISKDGKPANSTTSTPTTFNPNTHKQIPRFPSDPHLFGDIFKQYPSLKVPQQVSSACRSKENRVHPSVPEHLIVKSTSHEHYPIEKVYKTTLDGRTLLCSRGNCLGRRVMSSQFCIKCILYDESQVLYVRGKYGDKDPILKGTPDVLPLPEERRW